MSDLFAEHNDEFLPTRAAGLARLDRFAPKAGRAYASGRNFDFGPGRRGNVSALSPWIRHRLITEEEVLRAVLARHSFATAEKFIQEVFWRGYFKGWLEHHPTVWTSYQTGVLRALDDGCDDADYHDAIAGRTGISCFDHWAKELCDTGYLHNHARMWFASIWIFTLRLPWELGADFFMRHLLDGDPAANTLGWRWVAGLHTKGKHYVARASNIARYTDGRFNPEGQLACNPDPLTETAPPALRPLSTPAPLPKDDCLLLVTEDDCQIETQLPCTPIARLGLPATAGRSPQLVSPRVHEFTNAALGVSSDVVGDANLCWADQIIAAADIAGVQTVVTGYAPVGPTSAQLARCTAAGLRVSALRRSYDAHVWPHCQKGFFALKKKIPNISQKLDI